MPQQQKINQISNDSRYMAQMKKWFRKIHRWLGVLMALQIIAWMASGLYFAWFPIETIRGEHLVAEPEVLSARDLDALLPASEAWRAAQESLGGSAEPGTASLIRSRGQTWYRFAGTLDGAGYIRLVDARSGEVMEFMDAGQARAVATASLLAPGTVSEVELVTESQPGSEYRGRELPLWRVSYTEPESLNLYIDGWTGEVVARRTARWRVFDFLWMLHIMDFEERDDFNTLLLQLAAALGLVLGITGLIYWLMTTRLFRKRAA
jgi:hypothetical protein